MNCKTLLFGILLLSLAIFLPAPAWAQIKDCRDGFTLVAVGDPDPTAMARLICVPDATAEQLADVQQTLCPCFSQGDIAAAQNTDTNFLCGVQQGTSDGAGGICTKGECTGDSTSFLAIAAPEGQHCGPKRRRVT